MSIMDMISGFLPQATAPSPLQGNEPLQSTAVKTESKAGPKFSREDLRAVLADPEITQAMKQASKDGMKEGYLELMKKFMAKLPQLLVPMLSMGAAGTDPIAAFKNFTDGLMNAFEDITGTKTAVAPQTVVEAKPKADSSQANDMMKILQQALSQTSTATN